MPKVPANFKGSKSYYERKTAGPVAANQSINKVKGAKFHSKAGNSSFAQKQAKGKVN